MSTGHIADASFRVRPWLVQPNLNAISCNGTKVQLEPKVMSVLVCLAEHPGDPVSKEKLLQTVWPDTFVGDGVLTRSISELRRVFEDEAKEPRVIQTIAKRGYRLVAPVTPVNGAPTEMSPPVLDFTPEDSYTSEPCIFVSIDFPGPYSFGKSNGAAGGGGIGGLLHFPALRC